MGGRSRWAQSRRRAPALAAVERRHRYMPLPVLMGTRRLEFRVANVKLTPQRWASTFAAARSLPAFGWSRSSARERWAPSTWLTKRALVAALP
jgi:hypothetical protein